MFFDNGKVWKWLVISTVLRNVLYPSKFHRFLKWVQQFMEIYILRKIKAGQTRNGKKVLCVRRRPIRLAALLNDFTKLTKEERDGLLILMNVETCVLIEKAIDI
jgi:hypothetical protein